MNMALVAALLWAQSSLDASLAEARKELGEGHLFTTALELYVVASDGDQDTLDRGLGTIERVYRAMNKDFMKTKPERPLKVYLFKGNESYVEYNKKIYGREPTTPYGFYMPSERKMVMNIATGTGTLAHELVHPLIEADFPSVPSWFNEGFASLYEQSIFTAEGAIKGMTNWRLPALQKAIKDESAPKLKTVLQTSRNEFYGSGSGLNYATARYLCYYLQEKNLLVKFYASFRDGVKADPTGVATLEKLLGKSLDEFEPGFRTFVSGLTWR